jgi:hypothetical protein
MASKLVMLMGYSVCIRVLGCSHSTQTYKLYVTMKQQYCVYSSNPDFPLVLEWLDLKGLDYEVHLNRTRFWIPAGPIATEFFLRWYHCTSHVVED